MRAVLRDGRFALLFPVLLWLAASAPAFAGASVTLSPNSGHPKITTSVSGSGFTPNEAVDIYFDTTDMILDVTDSSGNFGADKLRVPADALPGVGPSLASAIVEYRRQHGPFRSVDDLEQVPGVGPAKLAALRPHLRL